MTSTVNIVAIKLLDREHQVKCPLEKMANLQEAANYLDAKLRESMESGKTVNYDRVITIAALNIANELISLRRQKHDYIEGMHQKILDLRNKIDSALSE